MLLALIVRRNRASARYWLWLAASVKFLIPFSLLISLGSQFQWSGRPGPARTTATVVLEETTQPFVVAVPPRLLAPAPEAPSRIVEGLLLIWLCGFAAVIYHWASAWMNIRAAVRRSVPLDVNLPIPCKWPDVRATEVTLEPCVFGLVRPVLLVPATMTGRLAPNEWNAILAHEVAHIERRDNVTATAHMVVEAIFWFYPLVWWIGKRLMEERERACDEAVLRAHGKSGRIRFWNPECVQVLRPEPAGFLARRERFKSRETNRGNHGKPHDRTIEQSKETAVARSRIDGGGPPC